MALIVLMENLITALDNGNCAIGLFLDFQKAFDTVDHHILLDKLHCYGVRATAHDWFTSYLSNRLQLVNFDGYESDFRVMKCGVPQGSILGPLLFLIYINDLPAVSKFFMPILFADDTNLFCTSPNLKDIVYQINQEIRMIYLWVKANKLSLNIDKTYFMLFTPKRFPRNMDDIIIDGKQIMEINETKFLEVIIDNNLNWKPHITYISKKVAKGIGIILKARKVFNNETLSTLYFTLVYPYLNYCIHVWGRAYNTHLKDLFVLQNKVIRIINGVPPRTSTEYLYIQHSVLTVKRLYYYNIGLFMYKYSNSMLPEMFNIYFNKIEDTHSYNTRNSAANHLYVDFRSTSRGQKSCIYSSSVIWNFILDNLDPNCGIGSFKKQSHLLFLNKQTDILKWNFYHSTWQNLKIHVFIYHYHYSMCVFTLSTTVLTKICYLWTLRLRSLTTDQQEKGLFRKSYTRVFHPALFGFFPVYCTPNKWFICPDRGSLGRRLCHRWRHRGCQYDSPWWGWWWLIRCCDYLAVWVLQHDIGAYKLWLPTPFAK